MTDGSVTSDPAWDWAALIRPRLLVARVAALLAVAAAAWWRGAPAVLPAVLAFPLAEALVAWHAGQARRALTSHDDPGALARHLRVLGRRAVLALVPPLLVASALLAATADLPADRAVAHVTAVRAAAGVLGAGGYGLVLFLAAARRLRVVLGLGGLGGLAAATTSTWPAGLPGLCVIGLCVMGLYVVGLVLAAVALFDPRVTYG